MAHIPTDITTPDLSSHVDSSSGRLSSNSADQANLGNISPHCSQSQRNPQGTAEHHSLSPSKDVQTATYSESPRVPGAFPHENTSSSKKSKRNSMTVSEEMTTAIGSLGQYAKGYLPTSIGSYIGKRKKDQMPTTEKPTGSQMGVGSLPGDINKSSVAKLPDERSPSERGDRSDSKTEPSGSHTGIGSLPGNFSEPAVAALPDEKAGIRFNALSVPDTGPMSRANGQYDLSVDHNARSGGVGSLPGTPSETGVARLPEERNHASEVYPIDSHAPQSDISPARKLGSEHDGYVNEPRFADSSVTPSRCYSNNVQENEGVANSKSFFSKRWSGFFRRQSSQHKEGHNADASGVYRNHVQQPMSKDELPTQEVGVKEQKQQQEPHETQRQQPEHVPPQEHVHYYHHYYHGSETDKTKASQQQVNPNPSVKESTGFFDLKRAQKEQEERKIEIETGQRPTIFNAGGESQQRLGGSKLGDEKMPGTSIEPSQRKTIFNAGGELQQRQAQLSSETPVPGSNALPMTRTPSKLRAEAPPLEFKGSLFAKAPSTSSNMKSSADNTSSHEPSAPSSGPHQKSVPLGMEKDMADILDHSTRSASGTANQSSNSNVGSTGGTSPSSESQGGFLSNLEEGAANLFHVADQALHDAGDVARGYENKAAELFHITDEVMHDAGDVAREYVPDVVGEYIPHHTSSTDHPQHPDSTSTPHSSTQASSPVPGPQIKDQQDVNDLKSEARAQTQRSSESEAPTTIEKSSDTSRRSGEDINYCVAPSTEERISGRPIEVIQPLKEEYVHSITEDDVETGDQKEGTLPGYPNTAGISTLVGERMYDDHLRAAGAEEPIQTTSNSLKNQSYLELQNKTATASSTGSTGIGFSQGNIFRSESGISNSADHGSVSDTSSGINTPLHGTTPPTGFSATTSPASTSVGLNRCPSETSDMSSQERSGAMGIDVKSLGPPLKDHGKEKQSAMHAYKSTLPPKRSHN